MSVTTLEQQQWKTGNVKVVLFLKIQCTHNALPSLYEFYYIITTIIQHTGGANLNKILCADDDLHSG